METKSTKNEIGVIGLHYNPFMEGKARNLAKVISDALSARKIENWICSSLEEDQLSTLIPGSQLVISIGGDGTILRISRAAAEHSVPILSINTGKLGFMTELEAADAIDKLEIYLSPGKTWRDERSMLKASIKRQGTPIEEFNALNDVLIARGRLPRIIQVKTKINGEDFTTFKGDGILISTATGSTGYALSVGGPILYPHSRDIIIKAISPHLSFATALVLPGDTVITLEPSSEIGSIVSIDGQIDLELKKGDQVTVHINQFKTCFLRQTPPSFFYKTLLRKLSFKE